VELLQGVFVGLGFEGIGELVLVVDGFDPPGVFGFGGNQN
jgi:hypothetical protein